MKHEFYFEYKGVVSLVFVFVIIGNNIYLLKLIIDSRLIFIYKFLEYIVYIIKYRR